MKNKKYVDELIKVCFLTPQLALSQRVKDDLKTYFENISMIALAFASDDPIKYDSMVADPLVVSVCFKHDWTMLKDLSDKELVSVMNDVKKDKVEVGSWSVINDVAGDKDSQRPKWRVAVDVSPENVADIHWLNDKREFLCLDVIAAAVFMGGPPKK